MFKLDTDKIQTGIEDFLEKETLQKLIEGPYTPRKDESYLCFGAELNSYPVEDVDEVLDEVKEDLTDKLREIFPNNNLALIELEKFLDKIDGEYLR